MKPLPMRVLLLAGSVFLASTVTVLACSETDGQTATQSDAGKSSSSSSSSSSSGTSSGSEESSTSSSGATSSGAVTACTPLAQIGPSVGIVAAKGDSPTGTGGTVTPGTYVLNEARAFTSVAPEGTTVQKLGQWTLVLGATTFEQIVTEDSGKITRSKGTLTFDGVNFTGTPTCEDPPPDGGGVTVLKATYTATATQFKLYATRDFGIKGELVFEKK